FSAAGIRRCSRTGKRAPITSCASARAWAAPPISFFIRSMAEAGLMSKPPLSKQMPLPTMAMRGFPGSPHCSSIRRGAKLLSAATDHGMTLLQFITLGDGNRGIVAFGEHACRVFQLRWPHVCGGRVDQIADECDRIGQLHGGVDAPDVLGQQRAGANRIVLL